MRIIAGSMRGLRLAEVGKGDEAARLRPTSDRVRESLFNVLTNGRFGDPVTDARVLDLFAGTGALGLESLSRGAAHVTAIENSRKAQTLIAQNIKLTRCAENVTLLRLDATRLPINPGAPYTLIFLDPPYGKSLGIEALTTALRNNWLSDDATVVWEENTPQPAPQGFTQLDTRRYGDTHITLLQRTANAAP